MPLVRPLGIIHRRDRKLSETAQQFVQLLQSQAIGSQDRTTDDARGRWNRTATPRSESRTESQRLV